MCAADGMCGAKCPVKINTGQWPGHLRAAEMNRAEKGVATWAAKHFGAIEEVLRGTMDIATVANRVGHTVEQVTRALRHLVSLSLVWLPTRDINEWLRDDVLPKLSVKSKLGSVVLHPTCGCVQTGSDQAMLEVAQACG